MSELFPWSKEDFEGRVREIRSAMVERGFDALVIFSNSSSFSTGTSTHGYVRYVCNWSSGASPSLLVLPNEGDPTLLVSAAFNLMYAKEVTWIHDIKVCAVGSYGEKAVEILRNLGINEGKIGLVGMEEMPTPLYQSLTRGAPAAEIENARDILDELRMNKSYKEIELMRKGANMSDLMFEALVEAAKEGEWVYKAQAKMEHVARSGGAEHARTYVSAMPIVDRIRFMPEENWKRIEDGDQIISGTMIIYKGYWSHSVRMGVKGKPTKEYERLHKVCLEALNAGIDAMKPDVYASEVNKAMEDVIQKNYPGTNGVRARSAHAIGLDYSERPLSDCFPQFWHGKQTPCVPSIKLKPGMTLELHPNFYTPKGGAIIGDICLVTNKGAERLHRFPLDLFRT